MSLKRTKRPWFKGDIEPAMFATLALGLDPRFMNAAPENLNRYLWPNRPRGDLTILSSCSGVPITPAAHQACLEVFSDIATAGTSGRASTAFRALRESIVQGLRDALTVPPDGPIILTRSVAEAYRLAALLLWFETDGKPMTAILPACPGASEALPRAVQGYPLNGGPGRAGTAIEARVDVVQIPMRQSDGRLRSDVELLEAFHREAERAVSQPVVYGTLGDGTGAVAPWSCPPAALLVLDAAQMRLRPERVGDHIRRGWPVVLSGSGFLGAPGATGALALPPGRFPEHMISRAICLGGFDFRDDWDPQIGLLPYAGCVFRWVPALDNLRGLVGLGQKAEIRIAHMTFAIATFLREFPDIEVLPGRTQHHVAICGRESGIVTFAIRDSARRGHWLTMPDLVALYRDLAGAGVLLGHPLMAGGRAALRIAVSAEDVQRGDIAPGLMRLCDVLTRTDGLRPLVRRPRGPQTGDGSIAPGARAQPSWRLGLHPYC